MKNALKNKISQSYAKAMFDAALAENCEEKIFDDVSKLKSATDADIEIVKMLSNPMWKREDKKSALRDMAKQIELQQITLDTLLLMADNSRLAVLVSVLDDYKRIYYQAKDMAEVNVKTAAELTKEQDLRLKANLEKWLNKKVVINYKIEPEILGGLLIECGSLMFDDSLKGKLEKLKNVMKGND